MSPGQGVGEDPGESGQSCYSPLVHSAYKLLQPPEKFNYPEDLLVLEPEELMLFIGFNSLWRLSVYFSFN